MIKKLLHTHVFGPEAPKRLRGYKMQFWDSLGRLSIDTTTMWEPSKKESRHIRHTADEILKSHGHTFKLTVEPKQISGETN
jgi:hypothetical protein